MTLTVTGAMLYGFHNGNESRNPGEADYIIEGKQIDSIEIDSSGQDLKDSGSFTIDNYQGEYSGLVRHGDRLEFYLSGGAASGNDDTRWGKMEYGSGSYSSGYQHEWTGMVAPYTNSAEGGPQNTLKVSAEDFVYGVMDRRRHRGRYMDRQIAGSEDSILNTVLRREAPEIDRSEIANVETRTDFVANGMTLLEILKEMFNRGNFVAAVDGTSLQVEKTDELSVGWTATPASGDFGPPTYKSNDDNLSNRIRVVGGTGHDVDEQQTTQSGYTTVTQDSRLIHEVPVDKTRLALAEVWTRKTGSGEAVNVRLQKGDGNGNPVDVEDSTLDLEKDQLESHFLDDDGFTTFDFNDDYTIPGDTVFMIVESNGADGQDIGVNGSGVPAYIAHYPYPVDVVVNDAESISKYRLRDGKLNDDSLTTYRAAEHAGEAELTDSSLPKETISAEAYSDRAHNLRALDTVHIEDPQLAIDGDYIVLQRSDEYDGSQLTTEITMQSTRSLS